MLTPLRRPFLGDVAHTGLDASRSGTAITSLPWRTITGIHVSDGDPGTAGILGARLPRPFEEGWRVFYTQQHGDNATREVLPAARPDRD